MSAQQTPHALSDWLAAATQLSALEMPRKDLPSLARNWIDNAPEANPVKFCSSPTVCEQFLEAWRASQERIREGGDQEKEKQLRLQAFGHLLQLRPEGYVEALSDQFLLPMIAVAWGWAAVAGTEQLDPPMSPAEAEGLQLEAALLVVAPASLEMRLMIQLTLHLLEEQGPRQLLLGLLEREIAASLPLPDVRRLLWRFITDKTPQRAAYEVGELADAKRAANAGPASAASASSFQEAAGDFEMDLPIDSDGKAITALTPWEPGTVQDLIAQQLWQGWFESRLWLRHYELAKRNADVCNPVPDLPSWVSFGIEETTELSDPKFPTRVWEVFADGRGWWMDQAIESGDKDQVAFRQRFLAPVTPELLASALRICKLQFDLSCQTDPESDSFLLLQSWLALQLARLDGLKPDQLNWAKIPQERIGPFREAFGALLSHDLIPMLPDHRQQDWRLLEVLRPLLFAITAELYGVPRLLEHLPASARIWHPEAVPFTLRGVLITCLTQGDKLVIDPKIDGWLKQQCFDLQAFIALLDQVKHGRLNHQLGAFSSLVDTFRIPDAGHRIPAWLGKRLRSMKEGTC